MAPIPPVISSSIDELLSWRSVRRPSFRRRRRRPPFTKNASPLSIHDQFQFCLMCLVERVFLFKHIYLYWITASSL
jgi:hypothetical protein